MKLTLLSLLLGFGCGSSEHDTERAALKAWTEGKALLEARDLIGARAAFQRAGSLDPGSPALVAWELEVLVQAGELGEALGVLDAALSRFPHDTTLRYNRAALRARSADLEGAASDLRVLYETGQIDPSEVALDPDFTLLASDPTWAALVPQPRLEATLSGEGGAVLLGEDFVVHINIDGPEGAVMRGQIDRASGGLHLRRLVEDVALSEERRSRRSIELSYMALMPGDVSLGPWTFEAGRATATTGPAAASVVALPGRVMPAFKVQPTLLPLPSAWVAAHSPPWHGELDGWEVLLAPADATVLLDGPAEGVVSLELRAHGQSVGSGVAVPAGTTLHGRITRGEETLLSL